MACGCPHARAIILQDSRAETTRSRQAGSQPERIPVRHGSGAAAKKEKDREVHPLSTGQIRQWDVNVEISVMERRSN